MTNTLEKIALKKFHVVSDGSDVSDWIKRLQAKNFRLNDLAKATLSENLIPTKGVDYEVNVLTYEICRPFEEKIIHGLVSISDEEIRQVAREYKLRETNLEVFCLVQEKFSNYENLHQQGFDLSCIIPIHQPVKTKTDFVGYLRQFVVDLDPRRRWFDPQGLDPNIKFGSGIGFGFIK